MEATDKGVGFLIVARYNILETFHGGVGFLTAARYDILETFHGGVGFLTAARYNILETFHGGVGFLTASSICGVLYLYCNGFQYLCINCARVNLHMSCA